MGNNYLVTGAASGLGSEIHSYFGGQAISRSDTGLLEKLVDGDEFDAIFHCAFNSRKDITVEIAEEYVFDNLFLTMKLLRLPYKKFFYISSQDIYSSNLPVKTEDANFDLNDLSGIYPFTKYFSELAVRSQTKSFVICRPTTFLGKNIRPSTTYRILTEENPRVFLRPDSRFNYLLHSDVVNFMEAALSKDISGIFNLATLGAVELGTICHELGLNPIFGNYHYDVGNIDNSKAANVSKIFLKTSKTVLNEFIDVLEGLYVGKGHLIE